MPIRFTNPIYFERLEKRAGYLNHLTEFLGTVNSKRWLKYEPNSCILSGLSASVFLGDDWAVSYLFNESLDGWNPKIWNPRIETDCPDGRCQKIEVYRECDFNLLGLTEQERIRK